MFLWFILGLGLALLVFSRTSSKWPVVSILISLVFAVTGSMALESEMFYKTEIKYSSPQELQKRNVPVKSTRERSYVETVTYTPKNVLVFLFLGAEREEITLYMQVE